MDAVDLTARESGLLPLWLVPLAVLLWAGALAYAWRVRHRYPELPGDLAASGVLLLAHLLFFWRPFLSAAHVPRSGGDMNSFFFPLHAYAATRVQDGELPLWNPHLHAGMPHLANFQAGLLYPPNLLAYLLARPFSYGTLELLAIGHYLIASFSAYALTRSLGLARLPALTAGIVFAYSGFMVAHLGHYSMISAAAWLPLLLLAVRMMVLKASWLWAGITAIVVFLITSGGHQQTLLYALTVAGAWWAFWLAREFHLYRRDGWALISENYRLAWPIVGDLTRFVASLIAGLGLAAPMVLPSLQLSRLSVRAAISYEEAIEFSIQPIVLIHFLLPKVLGSNPTDHWGPFSSGEIWGYVGIATLFLAGIGLAVRPTPVRIFLAALGALALLYALGPWTPVHGWAYRFVPFYDLIRAPARAYLVLDLVLALLAAFGVQEIMRAAPGDLRLAHVLRAIVRIQILALGALILIILPLFYSLILGVDSPPNRPVIAVDNLNLLVLYLAASLLLFWAALSWHLRATAFAALALALIVVDLFGATSTFNPTPEELAVGFRAPDTVGFLRQQRNADGPFRIEVDTGRLQPNLAAVIGLEDIGGLFDPMQPARYTAVREAARADRTGPLYDLLNARYLLIDAGREPPGPGFSEVLTTTEGITVWENDGWMPRAWLAWDAERLELDAALDAVRRPGFDPRANLYLTGEIPEAEAGGSGEARILRYAPEEIQIAVETDRPAYLVLADIYYPGWQAQLNGEELDIAVANGVFRAVTVPAGTHVVVLRLEPEIVRGSVAIAGMALIILLAMIAYGVNVRGEDRVAPEI